MKDKLHCPFCNAELRTNMLDQPVMWYCPNHCIGSYEPKVWQALIDGKKARDALNYAIGVLDNLTEIGGVDMEIIKIKKMAGIKYV